MNLNPLKKDDNTDALVQALEDANNMDAMQAAPTVAADPVATQAPITDDGSLLSADDTQQIDPQLIASPAITSDATVPLPEPTPAPVDATTALSFNGNDLPAGLSIDAPTPAQEPISEPTPDANTALPPEVPIEPVVEPVPAPTLPTGTADSGELDDVKKNALNQLRPLIEKLDLEPADKFDKYLMMLRASDDPALIKPAFDAAQGILGEQEKAQALLDIINEINYITANHQQ